MKNKLNYIMIGNFENKREILLYDEQNDLFQKIVKIIL